MVNNWYKGILLKMATFAMVMDWKYTHFGKVIRPGIEQQWTENLKAVLEGWKRLNFCIASIISIIDNMLDAICIEDKVNKAKIKKIKDKLKNSSSDIKTLDTQVKELCSLLVTIIRESDPNERQRHLKLYDFRFETLSVNIKSCVDHILLIKEEIQNESKQAQAKRATGMACLVKDAGGAADVSVVFDKATSRITFWKERNNAAKIQASYEKLEYDVRHLEIELSKLEQLLGAQKRFRLTE